MLPVVGWDEKICFISGVRTSLPEIKHWNKTLKQPETVLAFADDKTELKQNCRWSAISFGIFKFQFHFTMCDGLKSVKMSQFCQWMNFCQQAISVTQSGKPSDKLELAFRLYDIDRNGSIDQQEMADIIQV